MIVVKVGGGTSLDVDAIVADIVALKGNGIDLVLVHGGAQTTNAVAEALGHPPQFRIGGGVGEEIRQARCQSDVVEPARFSSR